MPHLSSYVLWGDVGSVATPERRSLSAIGLEDPEIQATKNPSTLNQNGGVDGLHKLGTSKKSSGTNYDYPLKEKFCA
ncbi:hypothetical protein F8O53_12525 [Enterobacter sp. 63]